MDYIEVDEDGCEKVNRFGRREGEVKKAPKNLVAKDLQRRFIELCRKNVGVKPLENFAGYVLVLRAMDKGGLSREDVLDLFEEWFTLGRSDTDAVQITQALSDVQINAYKVRNNK